ncbi:hypothetical protein H5410_036148 [Solanum commersonii]|uniref:Uncharacterized protein n=1 Tax=Solanum commersonii TaxID=4109 RepID=A0A9J5Y6P7_SOLCO|nr:hypothetical protein H5410_036148 [Solanum commersonii]
MSPNLGLINTPNLKFCLSSSKTQVQHFKKGCLKQCYKRLNHECTPQDSTYSFQAQQRYSNAFTTKMISYSHITIQQFIVPESHTSLTLTKMDTCMTSPIGLPLFSNQTSLQLNQDQKGVFEACNGAECKGEWIKRGHICSSFFQEKDKAQRVFKQVHTSHKVDHKRGILSKCFTLQNCGLRSFKELASLSQPDQRGKF